MWGLFCGPWGGLCTRGGVGGEGDSVVKSIENQRVYVSALLYPRPAGHTSSIKVGVFGSVCEGSCKASRRGQDRQGDQGHPRFEDR